MPDARLEVRNLRKSYPGVRALDGVDFTLHAGEVHGLVGENGAGKSTLIKIVAGVVAPDAGDLMIDGTPVSITSAAGARAHQLAFIHQELNLVEYFNAPENVFLGQPVPKRAGLYSRKALRTMTDQVFDALEVTMPLNLPVRYLAPGQRAMVAVARAFAHEASIYFMDEPTTALTAQEKHHLFALIRRLRDHGKSIVYVTHNLDDVFDITDRVTVLREGKRIGSWGSTKVDKDNLIEAMIGQALHKEPLQTQREPGASLLTVTDLAGYGIGPVGFTLHAGEVLGIGGLVGAGRSTLLHLIAGALKRRSGTMVLSGGRYAPRSPQEALSRGVVLIPEERRAQGLALGLSVHANTVVSSLAQFSKAGLMSSSKAAAAAERAGQRARLKAASYRQTVQTLSGGNQQKVLFARALLASPRVLLLDEPTKGVDVAARYEIYDIVRRLAADGVGVVLVSSDFEEVLTLSERIVFLHEGSQGVTVTNTRLSQNDYLRLCYEGANDEH